MRLPEARRKHAASCEAEKEVIEEEEEEEDCVAEVEVEEEVVERADNMGDKEDEEANSLDSSFASITHSPENNNCKY